MDSQDLNTHSHSISVSPSDEPEGPKEPKTPKEKRPRLSKNGKRIGRPPKDVLSREGTGVPGARAGDKAILNDYKMRMLASPKSRAVLKKVLSTALEDGHPHQGVCMKMVMDRIIPQSAVAAAAGAGEGKSAIKIEITGIQANVVKDEEEEEAIEADFEEIDTKGQP